ncbi:MAG TPA: redoxin domain-containing protein [Acidiphilium sp.]|jgi:peroxiredoxin|uniref:redoxin domain-containing protein n=1 Tax=unclassified Acidiphilium TaxID=2617493 RepID=UPI000BCD34F7|nr:MULTISPECIES: redoxin domain-containing protein [unclassified Acidiphilium]OYV55200.1 MAG: thioredoxin peroxidase [Acidiphilium sp. 20-67-58]HQT61519.1 redoxin domain-containing protein [Acidiphilium sp.]HQT96058.1 redoxin domain-containing protein [Thermoanaerobaculaceae bacterium]HQU10647.1 redoxin domain-containing protein [Acidiphilium sp.]
MQTTPKLHPGQPFTPVTFKQLDGADVTFGAPGSWQALFVIRGQHCPICKTFLGEIEAQRGALAELGVSVAAVSADSEAQTRLTEAAAKPGFPLLYGMDETAMKALGLYVSEPRSAEETDHRFPEPGLFVVNPEGELHLVDISNAPFLRPNLDRLVAGLRFVIGKSYPVRGTLA